MRTLPVLVSAPFAAVLFLSTFHAVVAEQTPGKAPDQVKIGGATVASILEQLGARMEHGVPSKQMEGYSRHFSLLDKDGDGRHSKVEYIENGNYLTPQARRGIFGAADNNKDGFVTKAEYTLNRIITDEAKAIVQAMDDDKDGVVKRPEFLKHAKGKLSNVELTGKVFAALDTDGNGVLLVPEYLRTWGQWARAGQKSPEQRLAAAEKGEGSTKQQAGPSRPKAERGPPGGFSVERLFRFDRNGDGKITKDELPEFLRERILGRVDANKDGIIEKSEAERLVE